MTGCTQDEEAGLYLREERGPRTCGLRYLPSHGGEVSVREHSTVELTLVVQSPDLLASVGCGLEQGY